jgi:hypothetical protein
MTQKAVLLVSLSSLFIFAAGCGGGDGREGFSGTVTFEGQPLNGSIEFVSQDGQQQSGGVVTNGQYSVPAEQGLPPGNYTVRIYSSGVGPEVDPTQPPGPESMEPPPEDPIPAEFNTESTLTAEITSGGENVFNFDIP